MIYVGLRAFCSVLPMHLIVIHERTSNHCIRNRPLKVPPLWNLKSRDAIFLFYQDGYCIFLQNTCGFALVSLFYVRKCSKIWSGVARTREFFCLHMFGDVVRRTCSSFGPDDCGNDVLFSLKSWLHCSSLSFSFSPILWILLGYLVFLFL